MGKRMAILFLFDVSIVSQLRQSDEVANRYNKWLGN